MSCQLCIWSYGAPAYKSEVPKSASYLKLGWWKLRCAVEQTPQDLQNFVCVIFSFDFSSTRSCFFFFFLISLFLFLLFLMIWYSYRLRTCSLLFFCLRGFLLFHSAAFCLFDAPFKLVNKQSTLWSHWKLHQLVSSHVRVRFLEFCESFLSDWTFVIRNKSSPRCLSNTTRSKSGFSRLWSEVLKEFQFRRTSKPPY